MNPFDLKGPDFLLFYAIVAVLAIGWLFRRTRRLDDDLAASDYAVSVLLRDSYMIAYLRGGAAELVRVAVFGMTERKLLKAQDHTVGVYGPDAAKSANNDLERLILQECRRVGDTASLVESTTLRSAATAYAQPLAHKGLIATGEEYRKRLPATLMVGFLLAGLALIKISVALARGRSNVEFLIMFAVIALGTCIWVFRFHRTALGNQALRHQQTLFGQLKGRVRRFVSQGATNEAIIVAAVFGLTTLPKGAFPFAHRLAAASSGSSDSSSSSSSSSSCGGGGSSGGGGGCGGCGGS